jgi:hypothetical protein
MHATFMAHTPENLSQAADVGLEFLFLSAITRVG